ncbi:acetate/propionate family kinase [Antarcticirhabdus aurantiaca]|uniref:Acetate/propionate family kinase n=1 Tax=Antarcticirhabdus aurantiaca TaxID=2606717 RepID=A0ACD4NHM3_9HYPH|nr:acetate/propionate family kinase [Antarcticirhabdus aurantiaca]WAJ26307.1 acetate/propionate family kinase [Jeongeuplla avenae]
MSDAVLALNAGSSSIKFALYARAGDDLVLARRGEVEDVGGDGRFRARDADGTALADEDWGGAGEEAPARLLDWIEDHLGAERLAAVGHRIVHGGDDFCAPVRLDERTVARLEALTPLAPLHQPRSLSAAKALARERPDLVQVGCFDTAFHATIPPASRRFAIPRRFEAEGVRRFGFHGLSYTHVAERLPALMPGRRRVVAAHLGSGASLGALLDGRSVDTTMGFSALDGLVMATRCGALDPGVILFLLKEKGLGAEEIERLLYKESGLKGVSGLSSDIRDLQASNDKAAKEAVELFVLRAAKEIAAMAASLQGLDGLVFTGGIGEHQPAVRAMIGACLRWLGVELDEAANAAATGGEATIAAPGSRVAAVVLPADEEGVIARQTLRVVAG